MPTETVDAFLQSVRHDSFQAGMISALLFGIYTTIVLLALHRIASHGGYQSLFRLLPALMLVMYGITVASFVWIWIEMTEAFVDLGDSRNFTLAALGGATLVKSVTRGAVYVPLLLIADCIMIWRCWMLYNKSWAIVAIPSMLVTSEIGTWVSYIVLGLKNRSLEYQDSLIRSRTMASVVVAYVSLTLATTVLTTGLIIYRIICMGALRRYQHIAVMIVESSAIYAATLILYIPFPARPVLWTTIPHIFIFFLPGISTTLLIARVSSGRGIEHSFAEKGLSTGVSSTLHLRSAVSGATGDEEARIGIDTTIFVTR